jgi:phosphoribosylformylglycinamidine synthase subunit PurL
LGRVTGDGMVVARYRGEEVVRVPAQSVAGGAPAYEPEGRKPDYIKELVSFDPRQLPVPEDHNRVLLELLSDPDIASKEWVWRRYDYMVRTSTVAGPGGDAAVIRLRENGKGLAVTVDGNGRYCYLDPYLGGMLAVAEATRNLSCCGAEPIGITDCLNFGNPEKPEIFWQFRRCVEGMSKACEVLEAPVVGGNVSFYNEVEGKAIYPTPVVGAVGLLEDYRTFGRSEFSETGDLIFLVGANDLSLGGSQYLKKLHGRVAGRLAGIELAFEKALQETLRELVTGGMLSSAHDLAEGGLAVALAECVIAGEVGAEIDLPGKQELLLALYGEGPSRVLISLPPANADQVSEICRLAGLPVVQLGIVGGDALIIRRSGDIILGLGHSEMKKTYGEVFSCLMK